MLAEVAAVAHAASTEPRHFLLMARKQPISIILAMMFIALGTFVLFLEQNPGVKKINVAQAFELQRRDTSIVLLDVRTMDEWNSETGHLINALHIPLQELDARIAELEPYRKSMIIAYCRSGNRSGRAAKILMDNGFNVVNMVGGIRRWEASGLPVKQEQGR